MNRMYYPWFKNIGDRRIHGGKFGFSVIDDAVNLRAFWTCTFKSLVELTGIVEVVT